MNPAVDLKYWIKDFNVTQEKLTVFFNFQFLKLRNANHYLILTIQLLLCNVVPYSCVDVVAQRENYEPDYSVYHNVSHLYKELRELEARYTDYIKINYKYSSRNGTTQLFTRLSNFSFYNEFNSHRIKVLFAYGEHAREFFPVESLLYFLNNVTYGTEYSVENTGRNCHSYSFSSWVLSNFDIYIVALTNPDGRHLIERTKNYCWRGTANGIDLNRNFDWNYGREGSSSDPKDDEYRGTHTFSEPETLIFQNLSRDISFDAFVSFHSGVRHIYIPFADSQSKSMRRVPINEAKMRELARIMASSTPLRQFQHGTPYKLTGYYADGTSFDYMSGVAKIPFSLAIELWQHTHHRGRSCFDEFNPHSNNLQMELALVHPLYVEFFSYLYHWKKQGNRRNKSVPHTGKELWHHRQIISLVFLLVVVYLGMRFFICLTHKKRFINLRLLSFLFYEAEN